MVLIHFHFFCLTPTEIPDPITPQEIDASIEGFRRAFSGHSLMFGCASCGVRVTLPPAVALPTHLLFKLRDLVVLRVADDVIASFSNSGTLPYRSVVRV